MKYFLLITSIIFSSHNSFGTTTLQSDSIAQASSQVISFDVEKETQKYIDTLTPAQKEKSDSYFEGGYWLLLWSLLYGIAVAWIFLTKGLSIRIKSIASKVKNINLQNAIYFMLYFIAAYILSFPLNYYKNFYREHQYDLSNLSIGAWMGEEMIGLILMTIFGSIILAILYMIMRKVKEKWWIWGGLVTFCFLVFIMFIGPVFISPLFNDYKSLEEGPVRESILSMARANSVPADNVYQFDASKQSDRISANVSGIGSTIRVSLNDNLLNRCTPEEIKAVMGHELGHYVLNHGPENLIYFSLIIIIGFAFVHWSFQKTVIKWGDNWKLKDISDVAGFPLFVILFAVYLFLATPFLNSIIRSAEMESDVFGLNAAHEPDGFASVAMKLSEYRKINPGYWEEIIFFDHPSGHTRVHTAMKWKAENLN
ncbi:MAG: M48 family metallopeptidase [Cyclobacteriaceae bacterium]|nr:M48 family metallopeptidase [Cyclobacteriaceae bacterium]